MKKHISYRHLLALLLMITTAVAGRSQVQVKVILQPPYSPYFNDYLTYENKAVIMVTNTPSAPVSEIYFTGTITGLDNGVKLQTNPGYKPSAPILLNPTVTMLNGQDIAQYFSWDNVTVSGVDLEDVVQNNGLPEGTYEVCLTAWEFSTNRKLSIDGQGCASILIQQVEPPVPFFPACGSPVFSNPAQSVLFSWSPAPGAPAGTGYTITMVEMTPATMNPNDALNNAVTPAFFEKTVFSLGYNYQLSDPLLTPGRSYAWRVTAFDPSKKTAFRNGGISNACYFTYSASTGLDTSLIPKDKLLFIASPDCIAGKDTVPVGNNLSAGFQWTWAAQLSDPALLNDPVKLRINGRSIRKYRILIEKSPGVTPPAGMPQASKSLTGLLDAPKQTLNLNAAELASAGLVYQQSYTLTVTALDSTDYEIAKAQSCPFIFLKSDETTLPAVKLNGRLTYRFYNGTEVFPANHTTVTFQLVKDTLNGGAIVKSAYGYAGSSKGVNPLLPFVSITTDAEGKFTGDLQVKPSDTGNMYLRVVMNSPYYRLTRRFIPVKMTIPGGAQPSTLSPGDILSYVYDYTVTVDVAKGFPQFFYDTLTKELKQTAFNIDTMTINAKSMVAAGIPVALYRKSKSKIIPYHEAGKRMTEFEGGEAMFQKLAESKTFIEKSGGKDVTRVRFEMLVCNLQPDDEYYLKALIPDKQRKQSGGTGRSGSGTSYFSAAGASQNADDLEDLEGPMQRLVFDTKVFKPSTVHYEQKFTYKIISKTPPMSKISGQLVYRWPSDPNVVRPLSNARFTVVMQYLLDGKPFAPKVESNGCKMKMFALKTHSDESANKPGDYIQNGEHGLVVGTGTTDNQGKFNVFIINHNQKGQISTDAQWTAIGVIDKCQKEQQKKEFLGKKGILDDDWSFGENEFEQWDKGLNKSNIGENSTLDFGFDGFNPQNSGFKGVTSNLNLFMNSGKTGGAAKSLDKKLEFGAGPFDPNPEVVTTEDGELMTLERVFTLILDYDWDKYYQMPVMQNKPYSPLGNQFVVQAFQEASLGTFVADVDEERDRKLKVNVLGSNGKPSSEKLKDAKLVVFRLPTAKTPYKPEGEGTAEHPMKALMQADFTGETGIKVPDGFSMPSKVEWVLDAPVSINPADGTFNLSDLKLLSLSQAGKYYLQIAPNPTTEGTTFRPVIIPFSSDEASVTLMPTRITGRILDASSGKGLVTGKVKGSVNGIPFSVPVIDSSGYFEIVNGRKHAGGGILSWKNQAGLSIYAKAPGYKNSVTKTRDAMDEEGKQHEYTFPLEPAASISGRIIDEAGKPVEVWIMRDDSSVFENDDVKITLVKNYPVTTGGTFKVPYTSGIHKVTFIPKDPAYFDTTLSFSVFSGTKNFGDIVIYRRKHRMNFMLKLVKQDGTPVPLPSTGFPKNKFRITVNNDEKLSKLNSSGSSVLFEFENVSVNNYTVLVDNNGEGGYIPMTLNIKNTETREPVDYVVTLKLGGSISGVVKLDGNPVKNARVYLEKSSGTGGLKTTWSTLETRTDASGKYEISGVPAVSKVIVHATLDTSFTVAGAQAEITLNSGNGSVDLAMSSFKEIQITDIYGFPFSVEKIEKYGKKYKVTGLVDLGKGKTPFEWLDPNSKVRASEVMFVAGGDKKGSPDGNEVTLDISSLKMRYLDKYNVKLQNPELAYDKEDQKLGYLPLSIRRSGTGGGEVRSRISIIDNSFNYPSTYLSFDKVSFCLGTGAEPGKPAKTLVTGISTAAGIFPQYQICGPDGNAISFKFIGFPSTADPSGSYIDNTGKMHLKIAMTGYMPSGQGKITVNLPDVVLDNNSIKPAAGSAPLEFKMQTWTLQVKDWKVDPTQGGIVSSNSLLKTGVVDVPAKTFNLRHDMFIVKDFDVQKMVLGGGVLELSKVSPSGVLVFDEKCGSDLQPHWRLAIAGKNGDPAALITGLGTAFPVNTLELTYIQLISYGLGDKAENILTLGEIPGGVSNLFGNPLMTFFPKAISSGDGAFYLNGDLKFKVPRMNASFLDIEFKKLGTKLISEAMPFNNSFEAPGYVRFTTDKNIKPKFEPEKGLATLYGTVEEPGKLRPIECRLVFGTGEKGRIYLTANKKLSLLSSESGLSLTISDDVEKNGMRVNDDDWSLLSFSGELDDPQSKGMSKKPKPVFNFTVHGEINASSEKLEIDNINTPFGKLALTYDFPGKELRGTLEIPDGTEIGSYKFGGNLETRFGDKGFVICGSGQLNTGTLLAEGFGTFNSGFLLANYSLDDGLIKKATTYSLNPANVCWLSNNAANFKGFFFCGGYDILNVQKGFDIAIASVYLHATVGVEASLGMNFSKGANIRMGVGAHGKVEAGMAAITGTTIDGTVDINVNASADYMQGVGFGLDGSAFATVTYKACQSYIADEICFGGSKEARIDFGLGPACQKKKAYYEFQLGAPGKLTSCQP